MLVAGKGSDCAQTASIQVMHPMQLLQIWEAWSWSSLKDIKSHNDCCLVCKAYSGNALPMGPIAYHLRWNWID